MKMDEKMELIELSIEEERGFEIWEPNRMIYRVRQRGW